MKRISGILVVLALMLVVAPRAQALSVYGSYWRAYDRNKNGFRILLRHRQSITPLFALDGRACWVGFDGFNVYPLELTGVARLGIFYGGPGVGYYISDGEIRLDSS